MAELPKPGDKWAFTVMPPADRVEWENKHPRPLIKLGEFTAELIYTPAFVPINVNPTQKEKPMSNWVKFDDVHLDLPLVNFCLKVREARALAVKGKWPADHDHILLSMAFYKLLEDKYPELKDGALISYGLDPARQMVYFGFTHRALPGTHPCRQPPSWSLLHRCISCRDPINLDDEGVQLLLAPGTDMSGCQNINYRCVACQKGPHQGLLSKWTERENPIKTVVEWVGDADTKQEMVQEMLSDWPKTKTQMVDEKDCEIVEPTEFEKAWGLVTAGMGVPPEVFKGQHNSQLVASTDTMEKCKAIQERLRKQRGLDK